MRQEVSTTYLEMLSPDRLRAKPQPRQGLRLVRLERPIPALNHYFFMEVGRPWRWYSRLSWSLPQWQDWLNRPGVYTWVLLMGDTPLGYAELQQAENGVELVFFGLLPAEVSQGLGGWFLSEVVKRAWRLQPGRVWLHTCDLDHPHATANYLARGFTVYQVETQMETIPDEDDPIWSAPPPDDSWADLCGGPDRLAALIKAHPVSG